MVRYMLRYIIAYYIILCSCKMLQLHYGGGRGVFTIITYKCFLSSYSSFFFYLRQTFKFACFWWRYVTRMKCIVLKNKDHGTGCAIMYTAHTYTRLTHTTGCVSASLSPESLRSTRVYATEVKFCANRLRLIKMLTLRNSFIQKIFVLPLSHNKNTQIILYYYKSYCNEILQVYTRK